MRYAHAHANTNTKKDGQITIFLSEYGFLAGSIAFNGVVVAAAAFVVVVVVVVVVVAVDIQHIGKDATTQVLKYSDWMIPNPAMKTI